jgi:hypothetical protein
MTRSGDIEPASRLSVTSPKQQPDCIPPTNLPQAEIGAHKYPYNCDAWRHGRPSQCHGSHSANNMESTHKNPTGAAKGCARSASRLHATRQPRGWYPRCMQRSTPVAPNLCMVSLRSRYRKQLGARCFQLPTPQHCTVAALWGPHVTRQLHTAVVSHRAASPAAGPRLLPRMISSLAIRHNICNGEVLSSTWRTHEWW